MKKIKPILIVVLTIITLQSASAQSSKREFLDVGNTLSVYPKVEWIKGEPLTEFDKKKIYIIDLWATWCKPCILSMPHFNELSTKFSSKGVVFIAQDVMEDNKKKVVDFVAANQKMMGFNVAFGGGIGSDFERDWIKPAGVSTIPQTFVIQNNILVWQTTPDMINDEVIEMLIKGEFTIEKAKMAISKGK